jgi:hypothetical protein
MTDEKAGSSVNEDFVLFDACLSGVRALATIEVTGDDDGTISEIASLATRESKSFLAALVKFDPQLTRGFVAALLSTQLMKWHEGGAAFFEEFTAIFERELEALGDPLIKGLMKAMFAMKRHHAPGLADPRLASAGFGEAADILERGNHVPEALACALSATNFLPPRSTWEEVEVPARRALTLCRREGLVDQASRCLVRLVDARLRAAEDPDRDLVLFGLLEELMRTPPQTPQQRLLAARLLEPLNSRCRTAKALRALFFSVLLQGTPAVAATPAAPVIPLMAFEWNLGAADLEAHLPMFENLMTEVEDERFVRLQPVEGVQAEANWADFTFRHPVLQRMMPVGTAFRKLANFEEMLLAIHHEVTHVVTCLGGNVGLSVLAIRAAIMETEADLWSRVAAGKPDLAKQIFSRGVAPLDAAEGDAWALALVERQLDLFRKGVLLQETWASWLEGVAIYAELHADSTHDEALSDMAMVTMNLEDQRIMGAASDDVETLKLVSEKAREMERAYGAAARAVGPYRLRTYLDGYSSKYLPGYFAVRAVVANWRWRFPRPLPGAQALRALIHLTRYGSDEAVPHLGLNVGAFGQAAADNIERWLQTISNVSADDLERLLRLPNDGPIEPGRWKNGRLVTNLTAPQDAQDLKGAEQRFDERLAEARSSMTTPHTSPKRLGPSGDAVDDDVLELFLAHVAQELCTWPRDKPLLNYTVLDRLASRYLILPIAETTAPIWLNVPTNTMVVLLRASDGDGPARSRHVVFRVTLPADRAQSLREAVARSGATRITVTRVAFLGQWVPQRRTGWNYLVFRLGDWCHVIPGGMAFGIPHVDEEIERLVRARFYPNDLAAFEQNVTALGTRCAQRTRDWVRGVRTWHGAADSAIRHWATYVDDIAREVVEADGTNAPQGVLASKRLVSFALGDDVAAQAALDNGIHMGATGGPWVMAAIRLLAESGSSALEHLPEASHTIPKGVFERLFQRGPWGWDFRATRTSTRRAT